MASLEYRTIELDNQRRSVCGRVLGHYTLPPHRLLCFFDTDNPEDLDRQIGAVFCGVHAPIIGSGLVWPPYVDSLFVDSLGEFSHDNVIYVNGRTCATPAGTVITFAHELQHFVQYGTLRKVWRANSLIYRILRDGPPTMIKPWDIPLEKEAMAVSKTVATSVLGEEAVKNHTKAEISGNDPEKWKFFQSLPVHHTGFNLLEETKPWVDKYREQLRAIKQNDVDFLQVEWWR